MVYNQTKAGGGANQISSMMINPKRSVFLVAALSICAQQTTVSAFICSSKQRSKNHIQKVSSFTTTAAAASADDNDDFFDPFLHSPHSYPDGIENGPSDDNEDGVEGMIVDAIFESSASFGFMSISEPSSSSATKVTNTNGDDDMFDPLLSPHAYPDGVDAGPIGQQQQQQKQQSKKLGIILIDHGSKREASNQHLHFIAQTYQASIIQRDNMANGEGGSTATSGRQTVVRAAHMEIAQPSILESLVSASSVVCRRSQLSEALYSLILYTDRNANVNDSPSNKSRFCFSPSSNLTNYGQTKYISSKTTYHREIS